MSSMATLHWIVVCVLLVLTCSSNAMSRKRQLELRCCPTTSSEGITDERIETRQRQRFITDTGAIWTMGFPQMNYGLSRALAEDRTNSIRTNSFSPLESNINPYSMNIGINDVCGDYSLTLIDSLDALAVLPGAMTILSVDSRRLRRIRTRHRHRDPPCKDL
jgi:hypothetical protein